jgi:glutathione S-transferase
MAELWEREIGHPWMSGTLNIAQITLGCALGHGSRVSAVKWRDGHPELTAWYDRFGTRPSFIATAPAERR